MEMADCRVVYSLALCSCLSNCINCSKKDISECTGSNGRMSSSCDDVMVFVKGTLGVSAAQAGVTEGCPFPYS